MPNMPDVVPMDPSFAIVQEVNTNLADEEFRKKVRKLHDDDVPLSKMVEDLGLPLSDEIRAILDGLEPGVVKGIRSATIEMLDSDVYVMPLDCMVTETDLRHHDVKVKVEKREHHDRIHVEKKKKG
jgi:hypothetical protein